ncbi:MAG: glycosyltransferase family 9 protein [Thermodesulfovibrionia bacterium]|nr:glycosyltransferase family 9 protein [Thermodesulfovibrionia bacterium]
MNIKDFKNNIKNILIIRRNNIGDMICAIPIFKTIRKEFPQAYITVLADSTNAGIIECASFINKVIVYKKGDGIYKNKYIGYWSLFRQNNQKYDLAIALKIGFSSKLALITMLSNARIRVGCVPEKWHSLQFCYNLPVRGWEKWKSMHQIDALFEFLKTIGIEDPVRDMGIEIEADSRNKVEDFFKENKIQKDTNIAIVNISNNRPDSKWPIDRFRKFAYTLSKDYKVTFIITSTSLDKENALRLSREINGIAFYFPTPKVMDFAALVSESDLLICGEGGAMHIGAGVYTPTISLWGKAGSVVKWMHHGNKQFMIKKGEHANSISAEDVLEVIKKNNLL